MLFVSYYYFTYVYSPNILTTGLGFKPTKTGNIAVINDPFIVTTDSEYGNVFLCASDINNITERLKSSSLVAKNDTESKLFTSLKSKNIEISDVQNNTYYFNFKIAGVDGKPVKYNIFNCNKVDRIKTNIDTNEKTVVGYLGSLPSKEEFNDVIWLLESIGAFKADKTERVVKQLELLDTGDDFMRIVSGIDTYSDLPNFKFYKNQYNQAFTYSKVTGALTHELVLDTYPSRNK